MPNTSPRVLTLVIGVVLAACQTDQPLAPDSSAGPTGVSSIVSAASASSGSITIVLDMQPNRPTDVTFEARGPRLRSFVLDDDVTSALADSRTFTRLKTGSYTVKMGTLAGLTLLDLTCESTGTDNNTIDEENRSVVISLEAGESVTCTFVGYLPIWEAGDFTTHTQVQWGDIPDGSNAASVLSTNYDQVYASTFGVLEVGIPGAAGFSIIFTNAPAAVAYLPQVGTVGGVLTADLVNPTSSSAGAFGGDVVALQLNVDFSDTEILQGAVGMLFGGLTLCGISSPSLSGFTVRQVLEAANTLLGGGSSAYTPTDLESILLQLNASCAPFEGGGVTQWAQDHLVSGACP
jgi:hypothetical protein